MNFLKRFVYYVIPSFWRSGLGILVLPITTAILDPKDYGLFALVAGLSMIGASVASGAAAYLSAAHFPTADHVARTGLVSTVMGSAVLIGAMLGAVLPVTWPALVRMIPDLAVAPDATMWLAVGMTVLAVPWAAAVSFVVIDGRARAFAVTTSLEALAMPCATIAALYIWDLGVLSLFVGALAGCTVTTVSAAIILKRYLRPVFQMTWLRSLFRLTAVSAVSAGIDTLYKLSERALLARYVGLGWLGIYSHSQQYMRLGNQGLKAAYLSAWPVLLAEARSIHGDFEQTRRLVSAMHLAIGIAGIFFATLSREIIALLTHDKFTDAYILAALWMVVLMLKHTSHAAIAVMHVHNKGVVNMMVQTVTTLIAAPLLLVCIPAFGVYGAVLAMAAALFMYRSAVIFFAQRYQNTPFIDQNAIAGGLATVAVLVFVLATGPSFGVRVLLFVGVSGALLLYCRRIVADAAQLVLQTFFRDKAPGVVQKN